MTFDDDDKTPTMQPWEQPPPSPIALWPFPMAAIGQVLDELAREARALGAFPWRTGNRQDVARTQIRAIERHVQEWIARSSHIDPATGTSRPIVIAAASIRLADLLIQGRPKR